MDNSYGPLFASYIAKTVFRLAAIAFVVGCVVGAVISWWFF